jgi:MFS family permease
MARVTRYRQFLSKGIPFEAINRDVWLICISNMIGAFGEGLYFWIFPLYIKSLQADNLQLGLVYSALFGAAALVPLLGGFLADRFDRKKILIAAWIPWVFSPLIYSFAENWVQLVPGAVLWGISMIGVPAFNAYIITSVVDKRSVSSVLSLAWAAYSLSYIVAPATGSYLATVIGIREVLKISAALCGVATCVFLFIRSQHPKACSAERNVQMVSDVETRRRRRRILLWAGVFAAITFFVSIGRTYMPTFLNEQIGLNEVYVGLFGSISFAGLTIIGVAMGRLGDKWSKSGAIALSSVLYGASVGAILIVRETTLLMLLSFFFGGSVAAGALVSSFVGSVAPEHKRALWISVPSTLNMTAAFAAPYLGGYLYTLSPYYAFIVSISAMPFLVLLTLVALKE